MSKKKLCIFSFYDKSGIIDEYVINNVRQLKQIEIEVCFVSNGEIEELSKKKIAPFVDRIIERENVGFDVGGYKDAIGQYVEEGKFKQCDELILMNDTFYGPFISWSAIFTPMENCAEDFWGLIKLDDSAEKNSYLLSFFLAFEKSVFDSEAFRSYWKELKYPSNYSDACKSFERGLCELLRNQGFRCTSYLEKINPSFKYDGSINYIINPIVFLEDYHLPIIKKKALAPPYCLEYDRIFKCIRNGYDYDINLIHENVDRLSDNGELRPVSDKVLKKFFDSHNRVFLYGNGKFADIMKRYLNKVNYSYQGHIVTKKKDGEDVFEFDKIELCDSDGIIICVGSDDVQKEIESALIKKIKLSNVLRIKF